MNTKIGYFFIVALSHLCATESLPNGTPGTPVILSQYHGKCPAPGTQKE